MAYKYFNIMMLFISFMIVETVIASPIDWPDELGYSILDSMNNYSPTLQHYESVTILEVNKISSEDDLPILEVSVLLEPKCVVVEQCSQEICNMIAKQDESNNWIIDDDSKKCNNENNEPKSDQSDVEKEAIGVDVDDSIIENLVKQGTDQLNEYKPSDKPYTTTIINATEEMAADGTKYVIHFKIVNSTCITSGTKTSCTINDNNLARSCKIIVDEKNESNSAITNLTATCEDEQHALVD